jgi:flagellar biosynthetic protein FliQ
VEHVAVHLMARALQTTLWLTVPLVGAVAIVGVVTGAIQTVVQVQDQNISFLPKLLVVALLVSVAGVAALAMLIRLFEIGAASVPRLLGL